MGGYTSADVVLTARQGSRGLPNAERRAAQRPTTMYTAGVGQEVWTRGKKIWYTPNGPGTRPRIWGVILRVIPAGYFWGERKFQIGYKDAAGRRHENVEV